MKYYGDENTKRLYFVTMLSQKALNDPTTEIGYIKSLGKLEEYIASLPMKCGMGAQGKPCKYPHIYYDDRAKRYSSFKIDGKTYWFGERRNVFNDGEIAFYLEMPMITNDDTFHWHKNKKYNTQECTVEDGALEYLCIYKENGNGVVDVKYNACDNRHRNKVTIATIDIEHAGNEVFIEAIREWKTKFKKEISA